MFDNPAIWGPILVAIVVYFSASSIVRVIHAANLDRRHDHHQMMEVLNVLPDELDNIKIELREISGHTEKMPKVRDPDSWDDL